MFSTFQLSLIGVFVLATILGYFLIKNVPSLLHTPLMSGMNALSGICVTGAIVASYFAFSKNDALAIIFGLLAIVLSVVNVVGGFVVTDKMLRMISKAGNKKASPQVILSIILLALSLALIVLTGIYEGKVQDYLSYSVAALLSIAILVGIFFMSKVEYSVLGNRLSAISILLAVVITFVFYGLLPVWVLYIGLIIGSVLGVLIGLKVKMIQMPQLVALLNGLGGGASAIIASLTILGFTLNNNLFSDASSLVAIAIGCVTLSGSLVAAAKLARLISQKSVVMKGHKIWIVLSLALTIVSIVLFFAIPNQIVTAISIAGVIIFSSFFGILFSIRVGGADMPITISLLNSLSGVAAGIAGFAVGDLLLVAVGGIVGASGLWLTQIMCKSMNRRMLDILVGGNGRKKEENMVLSPVEQSSMTNTTVTENILDAAISPSNSDSEEEKISPKEILLKAKKVIIVPGYGMAVAQAQHHVKHLTDILRDNGASVKFAVHPVAGRMPGHMNVLLCEADVDYEDLYEMDDINPEFEEADATIVIGANDVMNPAAREAEGTPIYGMPILNVDKCKNIFIFNYDLKPGYAGVENPVYSRKSGLFTFLGNANDTMAEFIALLEMK
jgi:H+-translocating NAD(P) transhydrogenase subunit beta